LKEVFNFRNMKKLHNVKSDKYGEYSNNITSFLEKTHLLKVLNRRVHCNETKSTRLD
jgi:hypothetical protein